MSPMHIDLYILDGVVTPRRACASIACRGRLWFSIGAAPVQDYPEEET